MIIRLITRQYGRALQPQIIVQYTGANTDTTNNEIVCPNFGHPGLTLSLYVYALIDAVGMLRKKLITIRKAGKIYRVSKFREHYPIYGKGWKA